MVAVNLCINYTVAGEIAPGNSLERGTLRLISSQRLQALPIRGALVMGGKHGKYAYVLRNDGWYVKVRVLKSRNETDPSRYVVIGPKRRDAPVTYPVLREDEVPEEVRKQLYTV